LGDHATEADPDDATPVPTDLVEDADGIGCVLGHRVRRRRDLGATETTLVIGQQVELRRKRSDEHRAAFERRPEPLQSNNGGPLPDRS
jgi:hypothetical protein